MGAALSSPQPSPRQRSSGAATTAQVRAASTRANGMRPRPVRRKAPTTSPAPSTESTTPSSTPRFAGVSTPANSMITAVALPAISARPSVTDVTGSRRGGGGAGAGDGSGRSQANGAAPSGSHAGGEAWSLTSEGPPAVAGVATVGASEAVAPVPSLPRLRCSR
ncbi:hypothetical protein CFP66_20895 [Pseudonocardia sp. MH-G8]|nr:hypothetical protein CFP66_20895 [Pseudonocardia sp. MH-G8]